MFLRKELADQEHVPPFVIFSDSTLKEMCRYYPIDEASMLQIKGVGQTKFMKYGQTFMDKIHEFVQENKIELSSISAPIHHENAQNLSRKNCLNSQAMCFRMNIIYKECPSMKSPTNGN